MKRKYFDVIIITGICILFIYRFVFYKENAVPQGVLLETTSKEAEETTLQTEEFFLSQEEETTQNGTVSSNLNNIESENIWDKIMENYISSISSMIDVTRMEGAHIKSYKEEVRQDDWIYQVQEAYITKQKQENWDFVPDNSKYVYDEDYTLINDYSYVAVKIKVKRVVKERINELYLNSMGFHIYNAQGEKVCSAEVRIGSLNKPHTGSYFKCPLEIGEELETEIACVIQDCYLSDKNYYILNINNTGVTPFETKDFSFVSLPLGQGVKEDTLSSETNDINSEDIWDKIIDDYVFSLRELVDVSRLEGAYVKNYGEDIRQDDWIYHIQGAYITKQKNEKWDFTPEPFETCLYDENGNLINEYSYLVMKLKLKRVERTHDWDEAFLNSITLWIYDEQGEKIELGYTRHAQTAALNKPHIGSYFKCPLEVGEELETEVVYVVQDCHLSDKNYYVVRVCNMGVTSSYETKDFSFIKLPLGQGVKEDTLSSETNDINSEDIWDKIIDDYVFSLRELVDVSRLEGAYVKNYGEDIRQDDWIYHIQGAYITKQKNEKWDFTPEPFETCLYDENGNLINEYSYLVMKLKLKRVERTHDWDEAFLNSITLWIYDEQGEKIELGYTRHAQTAALNKPHIGSYFKCPLEVGEELETEVVYVVQDCHLSDKNYYVVRVCNMGVTSSYETKDFSFIKLPLGQGAKDEETDYNGM